MGIIKRLICFFTKHKYGSIRYGGFDGKLPSYYWMCDKCGKILTWVDVYEDIK
jgi:hypothetical protein